MNEIIQHFSKKLPTELEVFTYCGSWEEKATIMKEVMKGWTKQDSREDIRRKEEEKMTCRNLQTPAQQEAILDLCLSQHWPKLQIVNKIPLGDGFGRGVVAVAPFNKDDIIADYHAVEISNETASAYMNTKDTTDKRSDYLMTVSPKQIHNIKLMFRL